MPDVMHFPLAFAASEDLCQAPSQNTQHVDLDAGQATSSQSHASSVLPDASAEPDCICYFYFCLDLEFTSAGTIAILKCSL